MGTKTIRLDEDVYEYLKSKKRDDETFSEAVERLTGEWTILDYGGGRSDAEIARHEELLEETDRESVDEIDDLLAEMGVDPE